MSLFKNLRLSLTAGAQNMDFLAHHNRRAGGGVNVGLLNRLFARIAGQKPEQSMEQNTEQTKPHEELKMAKVLVLYHSMYGHIETVI